MAKLVYANYLKRFFIHSFSQNVDLPNADAYVVIPCFAEEALFQTLTSLEANLETKKEFCVLVVVNSKLTDDESNKALSRSNVETCEKFSQLNLHFSFAWIDARDLEDKNSGVGLARKIGMDAVIINSLETGNNPALICLDADCEVSNNFFRRIEEEFILSDAEVAVLEFVHKIPIDLDKDLGKGIEQYELFLEYYRLGLKLADFPFSYHTVGSSMACKAVAYASQGGMNQRKAGEDFYFLHKLFPHYKTIEIAGPLVFPSPRVSKRVPFGTGRFQEKWIEAGDEVFNSYNPNVFFVLRDFIKVCIQCLEVDPVDFKNAFGVFCATYPNGEEFLSQFEVYLNLKKVWDSSPKPEKRKKALFQWFDGLRALKLVHYFDATLPKVKVSEAVKILLPQFTELKFDSDLKNALRNYLKAS